MLSGGLADLELAEGLVPVIDRACLLSAHGLLGPTASGGNHSPMGIPNGPMGCSISSALAVEPLSVFAGEAGFMVTPNT